MSNVIAAKVVKKAEHAGFQNLNKGERAKKIAKKAATKASEKGKEAVKGTVKRGKESVKRNGERLKKSRFNPGSKFWRAPASYNVRKQHNILVMMWLATVSVWVFAYFASQKLTDSKKMSLQTFVQRGIAINFVFFVLSLLVMADTFAPAIGMFSVLVFLGVLINQQEAVLSGMAAITAGLKPPIGPGNTGAPGTSNKPKPVDNSIGSSNQGTQSA